MPYHLSHTQISHYSIRKAFLPIFLHTACHPLVAPHHIILLPPHYIGAYPCVICLKHCHNFWKSQEQIFETHLYEHSDYSSMFKVLESHCNKAEEIYFTEDRESTILCLLHKLSLGGEEGKSTIVNFFQQHLDNSTADNKYQI